MKCDEGLLPIKKGEISFEIERNLSFSFDFLYFDSFIKNIIRLRFTPNMAVAPYVYIPNSPAYNATSYNEKNI